MALSRVPSHQFTVDSNITIPTGKKLNAVDIAGVYAPGQIVQMQYSTFTTSVKTTTYTSWSDTGFFVKITPKFTNSKILVQVSTTASWAPSVSLLCGDFRRFVGGSQTGVSPHYGSSNLDGHTMASYGGSGGAVDNGVSFIMEWFDTSQGSIEHTYKLYYRGNGNGLVAIGTAAHSNTVQYDVLTHMKATEIAQ